MKRLALLTVLLSACPFLAACAQPAQSPKLETVEPQSNHFRLVVPKASWERIFFQSIDERAGIAKLPSLRTALPHGDLELRIWNGFGVTALEGFVLRRSSGKWSAIHLKGIRPPEPKDEYEKQLGAPRSGWEECWRKLVEMEILSLPDAQEIQCSTQVNDGMSYVVEINYENTYRTYRYDNPSVAKCEQAKQMMAIGNFIADEFDLPQMRTRT